MRRYYEGGSTAPRARALHACTALPGNLYSHNAMGNSAAFRRTRVRPIRNATSQDPGESEVGEAVGVSLALRGSWAREDLRSRIGELEQQLLSSRDRQNVAERRAGIAEEEVSFTLSHDWE